MRSGVHERDEVDVGGIDLPDRAQLEVEVLGDGRHRSPCAGQPGMVLDRVLLSARLSDVVGVDPTALASFELAGPRAGLWRDPAGMTLGVVTCGGLCPGLNDVVRAVTMTALRRYGVGRVLGFRFGFAGVADAGCDPLVLDVDVVDDIHRHGGTLLGSSRGPQDVGRMVQRMQGLGVSGLICIGGDGTLRGAARIHETARALGVELAVVAVPKTIDNDLQWVERSFGFATGVQEAGRAIAAAHATLAFPDVNLCLVPEVAFDPCRLLDVLAARLGDRGHAVVVVAEGAAQDLAAEGPLGHDASGNERLADVGTWLRDLLGRGLADRGLDATVKYIDGRADGLVADELRPSSPR